MFDLATKLITMTPTELLGLEGGGSRYHPPTCGTQHMWMCEFCALTWTTANSFSLCSCRWPPRSHLNAAQSPTSSPALHSSCTPTHPLLLSFLPFCVFVPKLQSNSFLRAVLLEFNPPSLPFQPLFHCEKLGSDIDPFERLDPLVYPAPAPAAALLIPPPRASSTIPASL